jgi:transcriptional regulator with XRE-family HTH domain
MDAVGAYIATLRERRGFTQQVFAEMLGISERGLRDWEKGRGAPDVDALSALLTHLKGSWVHIAQLAKPGTTVSQGRDLALRAAEGMGLTEEQRAFIEGLNPAQLKLLLALAEQMKQ